MIALIEKRGEARADSRLIAQHLDNQHKATVQLIERYADQLRGFGKLPFEMEALPSGQQTRYYLLNEDQAVFLLALSRNTPRVVELKANLVRAFSEARRAASIRQVEYLPSYRALHDAIKDAAQCSPNERFMHMNASKALNRLAGIEAGQRAGAGPMAQSLLAVGSMLAARAVKDAGGPHEIQNRIKTALEPLEDALRLEG